MENSIFNLDGNSVKKILSNSKNYVTGVALPEYIDFQPMLDALFDINDNDLVNKKASTFPNVNFKILLNKDGSYAWRLIELMHPALYVHIVNVISQSWDTVTERAKKLLRDNSERGLTCASQLWCTDGELSNPQLAWWRHFEQQTLSESIKFNHIHKIDVSGCYDSIYTHSIAWAIHGRGVFNDIDRRRDNNLVGNKLDKSIRAGRQDQTNGIPQGSILCDLIAELVLIDIDNEILDRINSANIDSFSIIRYVDDYNILTKDDQTGKAIIRAISEVLADRRMHVNELKVVSSDNITSYAVKPDKISLLSLPQTSFTSPLVMNSDSTTDIASHNRILQIYDFSLQYPNSGSLKKLLIEFRQLCNNPGYLNDDTAPTIISVLSKIAIRNPRTIPLCISIIERALNVADYDDHLIDNLQFMFNSVPFTDYIDIWLQRMIIGCQRKYSPASLMTRCIGNGGVQPSLWNNSWIDRRNVHAVMDTTSILNQNAFNRITPSIDIEKLATWSYDD